MIDGCDCDRRPKVDFSTFREDDPETVANAMKFYKALLALNVGEEVTVGITALLDPKKRKLGFILRRTE
jgi:hypothetical protein